MEDNPEMIHLWAQIMLNGLVESIRGHHNTKRWGKQGVYILGNFQLFLVN
jgi:hypothetical protein